MQSHHFPVGNVQPFGSRPVSALQSFWCVSVNVFVIVIRVLSLGSSPIATVANPEPGLNILACSQILCCSYFALCQLPFEELLHQQPLDTE